MIGTRSKVKRTPAQRTVGQQRGWYPNPLIFYSRLNGMFLFAIPARYLAVTPDLHKDAQQIPVQVTERPLYVP